MRLAILVVGSIAVGCAATHNGERELDYVTADRFRDPEVRWGALASATESAAAAGDVTTVRKCLAALSTHPTHDTVADAAAVQLGNRGNWLAAREVAGLVKDPTARTAAREKVGGL